MVLTSFEDIQKFYKRIFMHKGVAQKLSLPDPFEFWNTNAYKSVNFKNPDKNIFVAAVS